MKLPALSRSQVRSVDVAAIEEFAMPGICLMENAGRGAAEFIDSLSPSGLITILCGRGNNGGDGFVIARHLELLGHRVCIAMLSDDAGLTGDAQTNWTVAKRAGIRIEHLAEASDAQIASILNDSCIIVDAILGTGASGDPRGTFGIAIQIANSMDAIRVAIDLPSGLDCDSGEHGTPCFRAHHTCTFVAPKIGFSNPDAVPFVGDVHVIPIGAPAALLKRFM